MITVPLTSDGIMDFVDRLHAAAFRMNEEVNESDGAFGQQFLGVWTPFYDDEPWSDDAAVGPLGLVALCDDIRSPLHIINATTDYQRLARFNKRLRDLWQQAADKDGFKWQEPKPDDTKPGKSSNQLDDLLGDVKALALVGIIVYALSKSRRGRW